MKSNRPLYKINQNQLELINTIELLDGELTEETEELLKISKQELQDKSIAYLSVIKTNETDNILIESEIKRLQELKKKNLNLINKLKGSLLTAVRVFGVFQTQFNKFGTRKSQSVRIDSIDEIPSSFIIETTTKKADKTKIKKALKDGTIIKGATLENNEFLKIN